ncbi:hypothetical protein [Salinisphaera sp. G21_0]|uniref:hypothetical protein n=1 Tax=Salinisphaera sp. G21_0 TaxID=2821094 RepID=UPI001ADC1C92|nr:hypothetical protein [Salinisphaera sp. G21_0]MBO9482135.1 hypothetical protein [Salinisphaera sp. G21_0]
MDTVVNYTELPSLSGQTPVHKSTQTEPDAGTSGSLGPYDVSRVDVDEVVMFTGCLPDKEITVEKGRVVVKIYPTLNVTAQNEEANGTSFSIRFRSLPVNQTPANLTETEAAGSEDFDWDYYVECTNVDNSESIPVNTASGSHSSGDSGIDSHSAAHVQRVIRQPVLPAMREDSVSSDTSVSEGFVTGSALSVTSSSLDKMASSGRESCYSVDSNSSSLNSANNALFRNGQKICEIADMISVPGRRKAPVSRMIFNRLITYDPSTVPPWYISKYKFIRSLITSVETFILKSAANGMGWHDANGKGMNLFTGSADLSSYPLSSKFVFWFENNTSIFESICEAAQLLTSVENQVDRCFGGSTRTNPIDRVTLYETLSFKQSDKASIKNKSRSRDSQLLSDCSSAIFFYFSKFISKLELALQSKKYNKDEASIARKIADHTILEKKRGNFDLLNACVNYNLAVRLIKREYELTVLAQYDAERRADEQLDVEVEPGDLDVIKQLLVLIEALEEEGRAILSDYQTCIDTLPRAVKGQSFEERVLHMSDNGNGYACKPLQDIKSTLTTILKNHSVSLTD